MPLKLNNATFRCDEPELIKCLHNIANQKVKSKFKDTCSCCSIYCLYTALKYVEKNYYEVTTADTEIKNVVLNDEKIALIEKIYEMIKDFESKDGAGLYDNTGLEKLLEVCRLSYEIPDALNGKLAYIKWYTAHMANWPYVKYYLLNANNYDEEAVFQWHQSASTILRGLKKDVDKSLQSKVECDRLISYLSLGYVKPFTLPYYKNPKDIFEECLQVIGTIEEPEDKLMLYIELWNFQFVIESSLADEYKEAIDKIIVEISKKCKRNKECISNNTLLLEARYALYQYIHFPESCELQEKAMDAIKKAYSGYREKGIIPECLDFQAEMLLKNLVDHLSNDRYCNLCSLTCNIKGCASLSSVMYPVLQAPSCFHRFFGDYTMSGYYGLVNKRYVRLYEKKG